ncbi:MAG: hypothetical protein LBM93_06110 [Oscillospiraceae bacterium]|jgi:DNA topoisomerase-3|nr:hypothetical protein [Oscillospiraceae bacterium]
MSKILILCEKNSVAKDMARVLKCDFENDINGLKYYENDTFAVSFFRGHLVGLCEPDEYFSHLKNAPENLTKSGKLKWSAVPLPILPQEYKFTANFGCEKHLKSVSKLMNSAEFDSLICATDTGREGELIFRYVYDFANCKKPFKRLWISSLTDESIENGM